MTGKFEWCDVTKIVFIVLALMFFMSMCRKWNRDFEEEFKLFPYSDTEYICSKNCCATEWKKDNVVNDGVDGTKYQASNLNCNDGSRDTGCICFPKQA